MDEHREHSDTDDGQSTVSRTVSNLIALTVTAIAVGGTWWWIVGTVQSPSRHIEPNHTTTPSPQTTTANKPPTNVATNGNGTPTAKSNTAAVIDETPQGPKFDASRTSWQNPFVASHWKSTGWNFSPSSMQTTDTNEAAATFRRPYRKITVECDIAPIGKPGEFHIELFAAATDATMRAEFTQETIKLTASIKGMNSIIKQRKYPVPFEAKSPVRLRLTATGNRALVICDGKVIFNGSQPAEQSGKPLQLSLHSMKGGFRISDLRLEGE